MVLPHWDSLTLAQLVAQMVVVRASGHLFDHQIEYPAWEPLTARLQHWVQDLGVGGVIVLGGTAAEVGVRSQQLQSWAEVPLLIAADIEEGVGQRFAGATRFPPPMALSAIARQDLAQAVTMAEQMGAVTAREAIAIGLNWILAPVVDVNNNPANPVINLRAWGETVDIVSQLTTAFIQGTKSYPVLTSAKHFPGHGDTAIDSHVALPVLPHSEQRLAALEWPPFQRAIASGVDSIMTAHLQLPALDPIYPATLSPQILGVLRQRFHFDGLIVTDALIMGAIAQTYGATEAPVLAVEAGADIVLMPVDPVATIQAICTAVETGRLSIERIQASVERIWRAKQQVSSLPVVGDSSHAWEQVTPPSIQLDHIAQPEAIALSATILRQSMQVYQPTLSRLNNQDPAATRRTVILVDDAPNCGFLGRHAPALALARAHGYQVQMVDSMTPLIRLDADQVLLDRDLHPQDNDWQPTLLQLFIRSNPFRDSSGLMRLAQSWLRFLLTTEQLQALVLYGTPYVLDDFITQLPTDVPYVFTYGQMEQAQAIALEALFQGRTQGKTDGTFTD